MSRTIATVSRTPKQLYLFIKNTSHGPTLCVSKTDIPGSAPINAADFYTIIFMFALVREKAFLSRTNQDVFEHILSFLYCEIAAVLVEPENTELTIHDRFPRLMTIKNPCTIKIPRDYYLRQTPIKEAHGKLTQSYDPNVWNNFGRRLFDVSVTHRINLFLPQLLTKCLNAVEDLDKVRNILDKINPELRAVLLCAEGTATITHLEALNPGHSFTRTGTALQMAIYADDEGVQALLKEYMDPAEYERQAKKAFSNALPLEVKFGLYEKRASAAEYSRAASAQQKEDAKDLCDVLMTAIYAADPAEFICDEGSGNIAYTTSEAVSVAVDLFKGDLLDYTRKKPLHNRYILQRLHEIHNALKEKYHCSAHDYYLSQQAFVEAQLLMSARWVQHYAYGIFHIFSNIRDLSIRTPCYADIQLIMHQLRSGYRCLDSMLGHRGQRPAVLRVGGWGESKYGILCRAKQDAVEACYAASPSMRPQA